ncbi:hypothetical protein H9Q10_04055 [Eikenella sp. S3360]|uniref:Cytochrome C oxidase subunit IV n=1 Tax=Eikenella glucosivorans TaxID=2766967 RepID=A0ABS0N994_9NEIS|nr:hypothetical protein [Eikenella glucosivorans]MBH5328839.1 hypothetical protein [Eikenella glucosivorans]
MSPSLRSWLAVCLVPLLLALWFALNPATDATGYLLNGVVMSCAGVFLLKYVLFALVSAHLRQDVPAKRRALWQLLPLLAFGGYVAYYFVR